MPTLNRVQLIGRLGRDPEVRHTPSGKKVNRRWRSSEGEIKSSPSGTNIKNALEICGTSRASLPECGECLVLLRETKLF